MGMSVGAVYRQTKVFIYTPPLGKIDLITVIIFASEAPVFSSIFVSLDNCNNNNGNDVIVGARTTVEEVVSGVTICEINPLDKIGVFGIDTALLLSFVVTLEWKSDDVYACGHNFTWCCVKM